MPTHVHIQRTKHRRYMVRQLWQEVKILGEIKYGQMQDRDSADWK